MSSTKKKISVLLVEDHTMTRMGLQLVLEKADDIEVLCEAEDGEQAIQFTRNLSPDVILMDIGLPIIDGIEATQEIKKIQPSSKILIFTSRDNEQDVFAALSAGADAYIMKGASPEQLISAIRSTNEGVAWLDPAIAKLVLNKVSSKSLSQLDSRDTKGEKKVIKYASGFHLTDRELEILRLITEGLNNPQIAEKLFITRATTKAHVHNILQKLCVNDRTQAAITAMKEGLV